MQCDWCSGDWFVTRLIEQHPAENCFDRCTNNEDITTSAEVADDDDFDNKNNNNDNVKALRGDANTAPGCSKAEPNIFAPPQTPFPWARDGQNLISWRRSLPSPTDLVW